MMARKIIADALNVSESAIKTWEIGLRKPKPKYIEALLHLTNGEVNLNDIKWICHSYEGSANPP